jgi:uncharacterized membrane protein YfcA
MPIIQASANAKVVNVFTYVGPLAVLWSSGNVAVLLGVGMGVGNVVGAHHGVRFARRAADRSLQRLLLLCVGILFLSLLAKLVG